MLLFFIIGVFLILLCAVSVLRRHQNQHCAVLLLAYDLPTTRMEQALYIFAQRYTAEYRHWYVYLPQTGNLMQTEYWHLFDMLAGRWGFSLLSAGECRRLCQNQSYQFYFISAAGVLYRLNKQPDGDWQCLLAM